MLHRAHAGAPAALLARAEAKELVLLLDGDEAGRKAVERLAGPLLAAGAADAGGACCPQGEDPDTFARREGTDGVQQLLGAGAGRSPSTSSRPCCPNGRRRSSRRRWPRWSGSSPCRRSCRWGSCARRSSARMAPALRAARRGAGDARSRARRPPLKPGPPKPAGRPAPRLAPTPAPPERPPDGWRPLRGRRAARAAAASAGRTPACWTSSPIRGCAGCSRMAQRDGTSRTRCSRRHDRVKRALLEAAAAAAAGGRGAGTRRSSAVCQKLEAAADRRAARHIAAETAAGWPGRTASRRRLRRRGIRLPEREGATGAAQARPGRAEPSSGTGTKAPMQPV